MLYRQWSQIVIKAGVAEDNASLRVKTKLPLKSFHSASKGSVRPLSSSLMQMALFLVSLATEMQLG